MPSFPHYTQLNLMDCGPTCLRMVAKYYGRSIDMEATRQQSQLSREGVSMLGIAEAAEALGFHTNGVLLSYEELTTQAHLPAIVHWGQNHYVVVTPRAKKNKIQVADPAKNLITYSKAEFCKLWLSTIDEDNGTGLGAALLLKPTATFYEEEDAVVRQAHHDNTGLSNYANKSATLGQAHGGKNGQAQQNARKLSWGRLWQYMRAHKQALLQVLLAMGIASILQLIFPFLTQSIVDTGINTHNLPFIYIVLIAQLVLLLSRMLVEFIRSRLLLYISTHINASILSDFWIKLMKLPIHFFDTKMTGDIIQRLGDHRRIESFLTGSTLSVLFSMINLVLFSIILLMYNSIVFFVFAVGSILYMAWIFFFLRYRRQLDYKRFDIASKENAATMQLIYGMQEIKLNNAEQPMRWKWEGLQAQLFKLGFKGLSLSQNQQAGVFIINETKNVVITFLVAKSVLDGQLTLGAMMAVQYIIGQLNAPIEQLIGFMQSAQDAKISLERLNDIHSLEEEEPVEKIFLNQLPQEHSIQLNQVFFTYPGAGNDPVLENLSLSIPAGKLTAIVGMSGSGKTTLLKLLLKFYDQYNGDIKVGESNLRYISSRYWRSHCGTVMQDGYIFSDSIARNIAVTGEQVDYARLVHACRVANILDFVESLPLGFNTKIGAEGNGISAGQRQRVLIARAVYKNPDYIFFDEATNALDANNEKVIMENLSEFFKGKTVLVVAHRLSTVKHADKIIVLHKGSISEQGTHEELTRLKGEYYNLVKNQLELGN